MKTVSLPNGPFFYIFKLPHDLISYVIPASKQLEIAKDSDFYQFWEFEITEF